MSNNSLNAKISPNKKARSSGLHNDASDKEIADLHDDKDHSNLTVHLGTRTRGNIFQRNKRRETKNENNFEFILTDGKDDSQVGNAKIRSTISENESSTSSNAQQNSTNSTSPSDNDNSSKVIKPKSRFIRRMAYEKSIELNAFEDTLATDNTSFHRDKNLSPMSSSRSSLEEPVNAIENRTDATAHESAITQSRSLRRSSILNTVEKQLSNIAGRENIERNLSNLSSKDSNASMEDHTVPFKLKRNFRKHLRSKGLTKEEFNKMARDTSTGARHFIGTSPTKNVHTHASAKENIDLSSDNEDRNKKSAPIKPKSIFLRNTRSKSLTEKNPFEEVFEEDDNTNVEKDHIATKNDRGSVEKNVSLSSSSEVQKKKSTFFKPASRFLKHLRNSSPNENPFEFEPICKEDENISAGKDNTITIVRNTTGEQNKTVTRSGQTHRSLTFEEEPNRYQTRSVSMSLNEQQTNDGPSKSPNSKNNVSGVSCISRKSSGRTSKSDNSMNVSRKSTESISESDNSINVSKLVSRKNKIVKSTREKQVSSNRKSNENVLKTPKERKSIRERDMTFPVDRTTNTNRIVLDEVTNDDSHDDTRTKQTLNTPNVSQSSMLNLGNKTRSTGGSTRNQSNTASTTKNVATSLRRSVRLNANIESSNSIDFRMERNNLISPTEKSPRKSLKNDSTNKRANMVTDENAVERNETTARSNRTRGSSTVEKASRESHKYQTRSKNPSINISLNEEESDSFSLSVSSTTSTTSRSIEDNESAEAEACPDKDATPTTQMTQRNFPLSENKSSNKKTNREILSIVSSVHKSHSATVKESNRTASKERSKSQNYRSTPIKIPTTRPSSSKMSRPIKDFFNVTKTSTVVSKQPNDQCLTSKFFSDSKKMEQINKELEKLKNREIAAMKINNDKFTKMSVMKTQQSSARHTNPALKETKRANLMQPINKAFLVDGKVYKIPKLPRPMPWVTDNLYKFLWKHMEPKYKLATRVRSEKFVQEFANIIKLIKRRRKYDNYKAELKVLMKEMARLKIINTRNDFYHFCQQFLPYEIRVKVVPMLLPGNKMTIPYNPEKLNVPLLDE